MHQASVLYATLSSLVWGPPSLIGGYWRREWLVPAWKFHGCVTCNRPYIQQSSWQCKEYTSWNHLAVLRSASNCRVWKCEQSAARTGRSIRICGFKSARILPVPKENPTQAPDFSHFNEELIQREITLAVDVFQLLEFDSLLYILVELLWPFK